jgi:hypothetical protein
MLQNSIKILQRNATQRNATVSLYLRLDILYIVDNIQIPCGRK